MDRNGNSYSYPVINLMKKEVPKNNFGTGGRGGGAAQKGIRAPKEDLILLFFHIITDDKRRSGPCHTHPKTTGGPRYHHAMCIRSLN